MAHTFTETVGIVQGVIAHMEDATNKAALAAKNFDVTPHLARLKAELASVNTLNAEQEKLKSDLSKKTTELGNAVDSGYGDASGLIDAMAGMYGKSSPEAANIQRIRSAIRKASPSSPTPPAPTH